MQTSIVTDSVAVSNDASVFFAGLDIGKSECWAAAQTGRRLRFDFGPEGVAELAAWLRGLAGSDITIRCVMEHTGVYSTAWAALLEDCGLQCALLNPWRVRQYAQSRGLRSKTDRADSAAILAAALHLRPAARIKAPQAQTQLALLKSQLRFFLKQRSALLCRRHALEFLPVGAELPLAALDGMLQACAASIAAVEAAIEVTISADEQLAAGRALLLSIPGIGQQGAGELLTHQDKLLSFSAAEITAFSGLAPLHKQSGTSVRGKSRIDKQGQAALRSALYMCALSAGRHNPRLALIRQRLRAQGKPPRLILVALARHLLLIARSVLRSGRPFEFQSCSP